MPGRGNQPTRARVLVADDDEIVRESLRNALEDAGFEIVEARDGNEAIQLLSEEVSVALFDLRMPGRGGLDCLKFASKKFPDLTSLVITGSAQLSDAISAMKSGAVDYLTKPIDAEAVVQVVERVVEMDRLKGENRQLRQALRSPLPQSVFVGESPGARKLLTNVEKVARLDSTVLLTGESGVGKGLVARLIHAGGARSDGPFVTVSCTALPRELVEAELFGHEKGAFTGALERRPGKLEIADGGTLFLDEIGDMPVDLQPKLLHFLQERTFERIGGRQQISVDVRIIAATHQDLKSLCVEKSFREDLYFRLNVLPLHIPPLRERKQDILLLAEYFLGLIAGHRNEEQARLSQRALEILQAYPWPGNVRELENVLERVTAFAESPMIDVEHLPQELRGDELSDAVSRPSLGGYTLAEIEKSAIIETLELCGGNKSRAARSLGISEKSIYNKMKRFGIMKSGNTT